jgi:two-component system CheB/CheR fusion protein
MGSRQQQGDVEQILPEWAETLNRAILESALDCIITIDASGHVREFNPAAERAFGFSRAEAVGAELAELIIPARMRERHRQGLAHYLKTGEGPLLGKRIEIEALRRDGSEILVELAITPFKINGNQFFTAYLRNITERRRAEEGSRRLAAIVEASADAIISTDLEGMITSWNEGAERLFGYKPDEVIGKSVTILVPPERHDEELSILERIHRGERIHHYDAVRCRKDGMLLNVSVTVSPIKDESGHVIGASKIARDITERIRNERRRLAQYTVASLLAGSWTLAQASSAILEAIASIDDSILSAIWLYDETAEELRCRAVWHGGAEDLEKFAEISRSSQFKKGEGLPGRVLESKKPTWIYDVTVDTNFPRAPAARVVGLHGGFAFPLFVGQTINGVIEMFSRHFAEPDRDLLQLVEVFGSQIGLFLERRRIERELQREKERAEAANAAKDRFLATLSHELRTPLTPVLIWAGGTVNQPGLSPEVQEGLKMVCRNVELEARLIDDLLDLTRISRGKLQLQLRSADAHELLRDALEIVRSEIEDRHLKLSLFLDAARHEVHVDPPRLQQVFWNVFRNACKFTPEGGTITARSYNPRPNSLVIEISDRGVGIAPESIEKIFEAFEQVDPRREGLGLGLAIGKATIEMHGGTIHASSEGLGKGATFVIELPVLTGAV